jgi:branched-chain amino acid aminotransferase
MNKLPSGVAQSLVSMNGEIVTAENAQVSIFDRGFLYGDSIYEVTYCEDGKIIFFEEHLKRLQNSARLIGMDLKNDIKNIEKWSIDLLKKLNPNLAYLRIVVTRGLSEIGLDTKLCFQNNIVIIAKPYDPYPPSWYEQGQKMMFSSFLRNDKQATDPNAKSGNYLNNILALKEAKEKGFHDAILFNKEGYASEGTTNNIWLVKENILKTPCMDDGLLKGITRDKIIHCAQNAKIKIEETHLTKIDFLLADEIFYSSSTKGLIPITQIENRMLPQKMGPITLTLSQEYAKLIKYEIEKTHSLYR